MLLLLLQLDRCAGQRLLSSVAKSLGEKKRVEMLQYPKVRAHQPCAELS